MRDYLYYMSLLDPVDLVTMFVLVAVMLIFNGQERATMRDAFNVILAVAVPMSLWLLFSKGIGWPPIVRHTGVFVIACVALYTREGFNFVAATVGAAVLVVAKVGLTALAK